MLSGRDAICSSDIPGGAKLQMVAIGSLLSLFIIYAWCMGILSMLMCWKLEVGVPT